jgi:hypothetical protein
MMVLFFDGVAGVTPRAIHKNVKGKGLREKEFV